jgi:phosphoenolpyruvate synthase/pyruvate phosphate dikinase
MKTNYKQFQKAFKKDWYIQGFNAMPLFLNAAAISGMTMKKILGYGYSSFIFHYHRGYSEMGYLNSDFKKLWRIIKRKILKDPRYLEKIKKKQNKIVQQNKEILKKIDKLNLKQIREDELMGFLRKTDKILTDSVGIAHIIEPISIEIEKEFKKNLSQLVRPIKEFNQYYSLLTAPDQLSFLAQEEKDLIALLKFPLKQRKKTLIKHCHKYFWIRNSYVGPKYLTEDDFIQRLRFINREKKNNLDIRKQKKVLIKKLKLNKSLQEEVRIINFTSIWQDERKANVLQNIAYLGKIIKEISRRLRIKQELLYYLGSQEALTIKSFKELKVLKDKLVKRQRNTFVLIRNNKELISLPEESEKILKLKQGLINKKSAQNGAIHGSIANTGTAVGRVSICRGIESLSKVRQGDVLVTSMTRPEFMLALKKAAAIVTDEGGITCHAAIVARELNIPAVIGTKFATKILKDGMIVEVKGNHGIVNIIG